MCSWLAVPATATAAWFWLRMRPSVETLTSRLGAALRVQIAQRTGPRVVLHRHPGRECHRLFAKPADLEHVNGRLVVDEFAALLEDALVVLDDLGERRVGSEEVISLTTPCIAVFSSAAVSSLIG